MSGTGKATLNSQLLTMNTLAISLDDSVVDRYDRYYVRPSIDAIKPEDALAAAREDVFLAAGIDDGLLTQLVDGHSRNPEAVAAIADAVSPHFNSWIRRLIDVSPLSQRKEFDLAQLLIAAGFNIVSPGIAMEVFSSVVNQSQEPSESTDDGPHYTIKSGFLHGVPIDLNGMESTFHCQDGTKLISYREDGAQGLPSEEIS